MPSDASLRTHAFGRMLSCDLEHPPASGVSPPAPALARRRQALPRSAGVVLVLFFGAHRRSLVNLAPTGYHKTLLLLRIEAV